MRCAKCSAELLGAKRFCAECGAAVAPPPGIDPFASTIKPNSAFPPPAVSEVPPSPVEPSGSAVAPSSGKAVSPLASSGFEFSEDVRELVASASSPGSAQVSGNGAPSAARQGTLLLKQVAPKEPPTAKPSSPASRGQRPASFAFAPSLGAPLAPGVAVQVRWSNGQRYPGTIWQVHGAQVLVAFPDGQRHWVDQSFVERG